MWRGLQGDGLGGGNGRRDSESQVFSMGLLLPILLAIWALIHGLTGRAYLPTRGRWLLFTDWWGVSTLAGMKMGVAVACFGWYYLANRERWQRWAELVTAAGVGIIVLSIIALVPRLLR
jgi:hypothetical protein